MFSLTSLSHEFGDGEAFGLIRFKCDSHGDSDGISFVAAGMGGGAGVAALIFFMSQELSVITGSLGALFLFMCISHSRSAVGKFWELPLLTPHPFYRLTISSLRDITLKHIPQEGCFLSK